MTVEKGELWRTLGGRGELWGREQHVPLATPVVDTDRDLVRAHAAGELDDDTNGDTVTAP